MTTNLASIGLRAARDHAAVETARSIPTNAATAVTSVGPIVLPVEGRGLEMEIRMTFPTIGDRLPVILLSHGQGQSNNLSSLNGYGPVVNFWAAHGFLVIQPTHMSSKSIKVPEGSSGAPMFWRSRVEDMKVILDNLGALIAAVSALEDRVDVERVSVIGHSMGGHTASMLLGARLSLEDGSVVDLAEPRIKAGVLLAPPGDGKDLNKFAHDNFAFFRHPDFSTMSTPTLVIIGETDVSPHLTLRGADWHADPYRLSEGDKCLVTLTGGQHLLGGISGYDANETTDENPNRVEALNRLTVAYLRSALGIDMKVWNDAKAALSAAPDLGSVVCK